MERGIYKKSVDLNDIIVRTNMLSSVSYPEDEIDDDQPDEHGRYNHTYTGDAPSAGAGVTGRASESAAIKGSNSLVSPGNTPDAYKKDNRRITTGTRDLTTESTRDFASESTFDFTKESIRDFAK